MVARDVQPMLSFAQNAEDVVLHRVFAEVTKGFYVDIGASDPTDDSVTRHFYELGWHGVNVEPDEEDYAALALARPRDTNIRAAVGSGGQPIRFYPSMTRGHGTTDPIVAAERETSTPIEVAQVSLAEIYAAHAPDDGVTFLKVDVEGAEADVLRSGDWHLVRPSVVVVEAIQADGVGHHDEWEPDLLASGYQFGLFDGLNRFYCRDEDAARLLPRLQAPANTLDNWRPWREVALQDALAERIAELERGHTAALRALQSALEAEQREHAATLEVLEAERRSDTALRAALDVERGRTARTEAALAAERAMVARLQATLGAVYDSTSWRVTSPVRSASQLRRLMRRGQQRD